jgi:hypothetical protein
LRCAADISVICNVSIVDKSDVRIEQSLVRMPPPHANHWPRPRGTRWVDDRATAPCRGLPRGPETAEAQSGLSVGGAIPRVAEGVADGVSLDLPARFARAGKQPGDLTPRSPYVRHKRDQSGDRSTRISDHELFTRRGPADEISCSRAHVANFDGLHEAVLARKPRFFLRRRTQPPACSGDKV